MAELEGFLCPLCKQDCRSVLELESHYREAHDQSSTSNFAKGFLSFFNISPKQQRARAEVAWSRSTSEEGEVALEPVTNVSGIDTEYWPPQELGCVKVHTLQFRRARDVRLAGVTVATNRLVIRLEKLFRSFKDNAPRTAKEKRNVEQNMVPWKKDKEEKQCSGCGGVFGLRRRRHHCRLCGDIRCKECCRFMTLSETYPVLRDCPDYTSLAPPPTPKKKLKFKVLRQESNAGDDDDDADEVRMCKSCKSLLDRQLSRLEGSGQDKIVGYYEKMMVTMAESEDKKPGFVGVAQLIWNGEHGPPLNEARLQRQQLLHVYETIDAISKRILAIGAEDPSPRGQKLARGIRGYASNYLQEHLLTVPSLPTPQQLAEIKERREREARERLEEIERQREEQRKLNEEKSTMEVVSAEFDKMATDLTTHKIAEGFGKFTADLDRLFSRDTLKDISKEIQSIIPGGGKEGEGEEARGVEQGGGKGWMCNTTGVVTLDAEDDPFVMQRDQLLSFIAQAKQAKRFDEVCALEESLVEIEAVMKERKSYGF